MALIISMLLILLPIFKLNLDINKQMPQKILIMLELKQIFI